MTVRDRTVLLTGATSGIGLEAALELARRGARLAVVARDPDRVAALRAAIRVEAPATRVEAFYADLADLGQVRAVAAHLLAALPRIDVMINNAGAVTTHARRTGDGLDEMLATNYFGPFLLTHLLLDRLVASAPSRIVITGSEAHRSASRIDPGTFEDVGDYRGPLVQLVYARTKLLDMLWADELARRLAGTGVSVNSLCPGMVSTGLGREIPGAGAALGLLSRTPFVATPEQGARMIVHVADELPASVTGGFFSSTPGAGLLPTVRIRRDHAAAARIYDRTVALVSERRRPSPTRRVVDGVAGGVGGVLGGALRRAGGLLGQRSDGAAPGVQ